MFLVRTVSVHSNDTALILGPLGVSGFISGTVISLFGPGFGSGSVYGPKGD